MVYFLSHLALWLGYRPRISPNKSRTSKENNCLFSCQTRGNAQEPLANHVVYQATIRAVLHMLICLALAINHLHTSQQQMLGACRVCVYISVHLRPGRSMQVRHRTMYSFYFRYLHLPPKISLMLFHPFVLTSPWQSQLSRTRSLGDARIFSWRGDVLIARLDRTHISNPRKLSEGALSKKLSRPIAIGIRTFSNWDTGTERKNYKGGYISSKWSNKIQDNNFSDNHSYLQ